MTTRYTSLLAQLFLRPSGVSEDVNIRRLGVSARPS